jgi:hypothetical protein
VEITSDLSAGEEGPKRAFRGWETGGDGLPSEGETGADEKKARKTVSDLA